MNVDDRLAPTAEIRPSKVMEFRSRKTSALGQSRSWQAYRNRSLAAQRQKAHYDVYCPIALSQASLLRSKSISACCSLAIKQDYGQWAPLLILAWTNSPADS
jgi:hypothetical protein